MTMEISTPYYYEIKFLEPYTLSNLKGDYSHSDKNIFSDSVHAAITQIAIENNFINSSYENVLDFCNKIVVSNFYLKELEESRNFYYFPFPILWKRQLLELPSVSEAKDSSVAKNIKKLEYIELSALNTINEKDILDLKDFLNDFYFGKDTLFLKSHKPNRSDESKLLISHEVGRNVQSRVYQACDKGSESDRIQPYFVERVYLQPSVHFFFLVQTKDEKVKKIFDESFNVLSQQGIGSDKNVGNGKFSIVKCGEPLPMEFQGIFGLKNGGCIMNLSLYNPSEEEIDMVRGGMYQLVKRGGWITTPPFHTLRKRSVIMIREGSCFKLNDKGLPEGRVLNISPSWNAEIRPIVFRSGKSLFIRVSSLTGKKYNMCPEYEK